MTDAEIDALWLYRTNIHDGDILPQLRDFARAVLATHSDELLRVARMIEDLKRPCGMDPVAPVAIQNGRYMSIAAILRALAA